LPADEDQVRRLRELHESYIWAVNAAVGEGRDDLVWQLADEYFDEAMQLMSDGHESACVRVDCPICSQPRPAPPHPPRRLGWLARFFPGIGPRV
jgi:hypothetical protein